MLQYDAAGTPMRPLEPNPAECCGTGCRACVWITYWEKMNLFEAKSKELGLDPDLAPTPKPAKDSHYLINHYR